MLKNVFLASLRLCGFFFLFSIIIFGQKRIPEPKDVLGFTPGDDYKLASWAKIVEYFRKLDAVSDRVVFKEIGKTTEGRPFTYAIISSPENLKRLDYYKDINDKLADPRLIKRRDKEAKKLIEKGKTFVVITHGIHSTEVGSTLSSTLTAHRLASSNEPDIKKILDETIIVMVPSLNPDGVDIVKRWYDKTRGTKFEGTSPPELYQKYVGHDNNRDWYAFTQIETQLTVKYVHNVYHPQIVHDIHQQGPGSARFFVPPYLDPVEPNVPKELIDGYTEIGNYMANQMRSVGFLGITTGSTYDAWTPARAYSHYHGGVRILSETASAKLATPTTVDFKTMSSRRGFDVFKESENYGPLWKGGNWGMRDITSYMTTGAFYLMKHAAENREAWLKRFYRIGKDATRPRNKGEIFAYVIPGNQTGFRDSLDSVSGGVYQLQMVLRRAGVYVEEADFEFSASGQKFSGGSLVVRLDQPYGGFAKTMLEDGGYPNLLDEKGIPIPPYDVTSHSLSLLMGVRAIPVYQPFKYKKPLPKGTGKGTGSGSGSGVGCECGEGAGGQTNFALYKSSVPSMDEGWTRWVIEKYKRSTDSCCLRFRNVDDREIKSEIEPQTLSIIFPDESADEILNGYKKGSMPEEYVGGFGKEGLKNLRKFVEKGGTLIFLNRSSDLAIAEFDLPLRNVTSDLKRKEFFIPGSILRTRLDVSHPIAKGMPEDSIAWFERSPAFEVTDETRVRVIAKYPSNPDQILLSGWALGKEKLAGKAALVEVTVGRGRIILFGFRPQYRAQSIATFPLFFNSIR